MVSNRNPMFSVFQTIHGAAAHLADDLTVQALVTACMRLLSAVTRCVKTVMPEHPGDFPANITTEWDEFFSEGIFSVLLPLYINYAGSISYGLTMIFILCIHK